MPFANLTLTETQSVATLTLNRPSRLNALDLDTVAELIQALNSIRDARTARCVVLTGQGKGFSAGADLTAEVPGAGSILDGSIDCGFVLETHFNPLLETLAGFPLPIVAAVNGVAAGAGCSLALAADFVIAARSAYFLQAFVNIGLVPDAGASWILPRCVGMARALQMTMLGERIPAQQAFDWGMIYSVVDDAQLRPSAETLAINLANGPTMTYGLIRQQLRQSGERSLSQTLALERRNQLLAGRTNDFAEGVAAFREKRPARFLGH